MNTKTPKFDQALNEILDNLQPHEKICKECQKEFKIFSEDIEFYKKLQVPPPTLCPECRLQRRLGQRISFLPIFYKKSCSVPEHTEKVIAYYSEKNPVKVYDDKYYLSDNWETTEFGINFDLTKNFFEQYKNFALTVPHQTLFKDPKSINSDYVVSGIEAKDCYYTAAPIFSEKIYYAYFPVKSKECINVYEIKDCELCFETILTNNCYQCIHSVESENCINSSFLYDCKNCQNCFMSSNLRNESYVFYNKQLTKDEYRNKIAEINLGDREVYKELKKEFDEVIKKALKRNVLQIKTDNCVGDNILSSKNCFNSFSISNSENNKYCFTAKDLKDSMDLFGADGSFLYETSGIGNSNNLKFSMMCRNGLNLEYCAESNNCENCFACFGLKNKKYHIFNKPYSKKEYWQKIDELKTKMLERGEYGEFFPLEDSPFPYQDSNAQIEFPLNEEEIKKKGWHWQDEVPSEIDLSKIKTILAKDVPNDIKDISDDILKTPVICERTGKPFKILPYELEFYRKMNVPLPTVHPLERIKDLFKYRRPYKLYDSTCAKCQKKIKTIYQPETENVWCEECYRQEIN